MTKLEEVEDKLSSLVRKRDRLIIDINKLEKEINNTLEEYYRLSGEYVKVVCPRCNGVGYTIDPETRKKVKCPEYIWMKVWKPKNVESATKN